ncbi:MAG: DUF1345 domain-containing protein [Novosphingobium sp.]
MSDNAPAKRNSLGDALGRHLAPPRFIVFLLLLPLGFFAHRTWFESRGFADSASMAFDLAAGVFLLSLIPLLRRSDAGSIRAHADVNNANRFLVLVLTTLLTTAVLVAISGELQDAKGGNVAAMVRLIGTLLLIWLFANSVYALHYAHAYYNSDAETGGDCAGLEFPGEAEPSYSDFTYFSFTLGMTFQTSDVGITAPPIRQVALLHCFAAFIFNLGVIAFTINALGGGNG